MYSLIILNSLLNFFCSIFLGRFIGRKGTILFSIFFLSLSYILILFVFLNNIYYSNVCYVFFYNWIDTGLLKISIEFLFDSLSIFMLILIFTISLIVHIYSIDYMKFDPHLQRFMSYLSLFTFFMVLLVTSSNFIQLFIGWEGVGICSYLLISFWYMRLDACKSAIKAVILNKFGDCSLLIAMGIIFFYSKSLSFSLILNYFSLDFNLIDFISFFLIMATIGKSAQFFLHPWLADAMEGPTPVSALIHAATMVTAGIFLLIRLSFLINFSQKSIYILSLVGCLTIFFASITGFFQNDIKKIIAYSTCSQLGYMLLSCSFLSYKLAFFHLINHGFFKALLFLSAGVIIHNFFEDQDMRKYGGLLNLLPLSYIFFFVGSFSLTGFPFLTGFFSKDLILEYLNLFCGQSSLGFFVFHSACFCAFLTSIYSVRLVYFSFLSFPNGYKNSYKMISNIEFSYLSILSLVFLTFMSIIFGYFSYDFFNGVGSNYFEDSICNYNLSFNFFFCLKKYNEFVIVYPIKILPFFYSLFGIYFLCQISFYNKIFSLVLMTNRLFYNFFVFFYSAWFFNLFTKFYLVNFYFCSFLFFLFDKSLLELYGPVGLFSFFYKFSLGIKIYQINDLYNYLYGLLIFFLVLLFIITASLNMFINS